MAMEKVVLHRRILLILGAIFLFIYSGLTFISPSERFNSPDEAAQYFWLSRLAADRPLSLDEPLNRQVGNVIHSRSDNVTVDGSIVPGSFLGLIIIYGMLAKLFGLSAVPFFTPLLAVVAIFCFYGLVKRIFNERVALLSAVLLWLQPAWWYYSSRGLLPNVLFCGLLLIGVWVLVGNYELRIRNYELRFLKYIFAGLFVGLALVVRTAEIIWIAPVIVGLVIVYRRQVYWPGLLLFGVVVVLTFIPIIRLNTQLYGAPWLSGYAHVSDPAPRLVATVGESGAGSFILPFGWHPRVALLNVWQYYIKMLWWYVVPMAVGFVWLLVNLIKRRENGEGRREGIQWVYVFIFIFVTGWLTVYYGSWFIRDNISGHITIGTAYLRYWLPAFMLAVSLAGYALDKLFTWFHWRASKILIGIFVFGLYGVLSFNLVFVSEEGLLNVAESVQAYETINRAARQALPPDSIIISDRDDKKFWPEFRVVKLMGDWSVFTKIAPAVSETPVFYYSHNQLTAEDIRLLNEKASAGGLRLEEWGSLDGEDRLYQLESQER
ncbi:glycosyltransferase family 39 protein [Candidatus Falkowbacteria bacterium]|nr:glycosyltransferase family 39 protein [Candidatus Falkowbacteria bacterium]